MGNEDSLPNFGRAKGDSSRPGAENRAQSIRRVLSPIVLDSGELSQWNAEVSEFPCKWPWRRLAE